MAEQTRPEAPRKTPRRMTGGDWKETFRYVKDSITRDHLSIVAAGVAFYLLLGLIPAMVALISIYGLVADPSTVERQFATLEGTIPQEAHALLMSQLSDIAGQSTTAGLGAIVGIVLALWGGSRATLAMMEALNIAYDTPEDRGFIRKVVVRFGLTLAAVLLAVFAIAAIAVLPPILNALPFPDAVVNILSALRWVLLLVIGIFAIALLYRFAPSRRQPAFRWLSWGAATAAVLWVAASILFSLYVANFGSYNETYGTFGAIVILLMWLLLSAYVILLGAEIDAALELRARSSPEEPNARLKPIPQRP